MQRKRPPQLRVDGINNGLARGFDTSEKTSKNASLVGSPANVLSPIHIPHQHQQQQHPSSLMMSVPVAPLDADRSRSDNVVMGLHTGIEPISDTHPFRSMNAETNSSKLHMENRPTNIPLYLHHEVNTSLLFSELFSPRQLQHFQQMQVQQQQQVPQPPQFMMQSQPPINQQGLSPQAATRATSGGAAVSVPAPTLPQANNNSNNQKSSFIKAAIGSGSSDATASRSSSWNRRRSMTNPSPKGPVQPPHIASGMLLSVNSPVTVMMLRNPAINGSEDSTTSSSTASGSNVNSLSNSTRSSHDHKLNSNNGPSCAVSVNSFFASNVSNCSTTSASSISSVEVATKPRQNVLSHGDSQTYWVISRKGPKRQQNEDAWCAIPSFLNDPKGGAFGLFDGHGGPQVSQVCKDVLVSMIASRCSRKTSVYNSDFVTYREKNALSRTDISNIIRESFLSVDSLVAKMNLHDTCGSTASALIFHQGSLHVGWVGDSRIVLGSMDGQATELSRDHRVTREDEISRIEDAGGFILMNRVDGVLSISRAMGDHNLKKYVIAEPEQNDRWLGADDAFVIIASDGLWDTISTREAVQLVLKRRQTSDGWDLQACCNALLDHAVNHGTADDVTIMIVLLEKFKCRDTLPSPGVRDMDTSAMGETVPSVFSAATTSAITKAPPLSSLPPIPNNANSYGANNSLINHHLFDAVGIRVKAKAKAAVVSKKTGPLKMKRNMKHLKDLDISTLANANDMVRRGSKSSLNRQCMSDSDDVLRLDDESLGQSYPTDDMCEILDEMEMFSTSSVSTEGRSVVSLNALVENGVVNGTMNAREANLAT